jgi:hypothetical protein
MLPALYLTGILTILRLIDVGMESLQSHVTVAKIRRHYRSLGGPAEMLFEGALGRWPEGALDSGHVLGPLLGLLTTAASMIACVNGFIGGAGAAILIYRYVAPSMTVAMLVAVAFLIAQMAIVLAYQMWRIKLVAQLAKERGL